jgi:prepilin-type N-terminal cleavage/methylation domain-containing protein
MRYARAGFTLLEIAVAAAIMAMLAAVTAPYLIEFIDKQRAQTTADKLSALATGVAAFAAAVHTAAGTATTYPGKISELANVIVTNSTVTHNSCGSGAVIGTFNAAALTSWNTSGPFVTFMVNATGYVTPLGTVSDSMVRTPATTATVGTLQLRMPAVDADDATELDRLVDGSDGSGAGIVRWTANATNDNTVDLRYYMPIAARC